MEKCLAMTHPSGRLLPENDCALRAIKALDENRLDDAAKHISSIPDNAPLNRAWKQFLSGKLAWQQHDLPLAETQLKIALETVDSIERSIPDQGDSHRLPAIIHELLGTVLRRQDRLCESLLCHQKAYQMRREHGSAQELFESASSLGVTYHVLRNFSEAARWFERSKQHAESCPTDNRAFIAEAQTNLATVFEHEGHHQGALFAARTARNIWYDIEPSSPQCLLADVSLGSKLLNLGQEYLESADPRAGEVLSEAIRLLNECDIALRAYGDEHREIAAVLSEKIDFANRLASSLVPSSMPVEVRRVSSRVELEHPSA
jgi:tetratricopeptide (TPR) repeat protein